MTGLQLGKVEAMWVLRNFLTNIDTGSRATLGVLLREGAERVWAFPNKIISS